MTNVKGKVNLSIKVTQNLPRCPSKMETTTKNINRKVNNFFMSLRNSTFIFLVPGFNFFPCPRTFLFLFSYVLWPQSKGGCFAQKVDALWGLWHLTVLLHVTFILKKNFFFLITCTDFKILLSIDFLGNARFYGNFFVVLKPKIRPKQHS